MGISLLVLNGYLVKDNGNLAKLQSMHRDGRLGLGLIAIDEAHLIFDWQDFRQSYRRCEELHTLFPDTPLMAIPATVTPQIQVQLETFLLNPIVERSTIKLIEVTFFFAAVKCSFRRSDGSRQSIFLDPCDFIDVFNLQIV